MAPWPLACPVSLSVGFPRQVYWHGLPPPVPGHHPDPGIKPASFASPALAGGFFTISATWEALYNLLYNVKKTKTLHSVYLENEGLCRNCWKNLMRYNLELLTQIFFRGGIIVDFVNSRI